MLLASFCQSRAVLSGCCVNPTPCLANLKLSTTTVSCEHSYKMYPFLGIEPLTCRTKMCLKPPLFLSFSVPKKTTPSKSLSLEMILLLRTLLAHCVSKDQKGWSNLLLCVILYFFVCINCNPDFEPVSKKLTNIKIKIRAI